MNEHDVMEVPLVQTLFKSNPEYVLPVNVRPPNANETQSEFEELPPSHVEFAKRRFSGLFDQTLGLIGFAVVVEGNVKADHFWALHGLAAVRLLSRVNIGCRIDNINRTLRLSSRCAVTKPKSGAVQNHAAHCDAARWLQSRLSHAV
jgi:hypothetical protein